MNGEAGTVVELSAEPVRNEIELSVVAVPAVNTLPTQLSSASPERELLKDAKTAPLSSWETLMALFVTVPAPVRALMELLKPFKLSTPLSLTMLLGESAV